MKKNKGIALIYLIILLVVIIAIIFGTFFIIKTNINKGTKESKLSNNNEGENIKYNENEEIKTTTKQNGHWTQEGTKLTDGNVTIYIGDYVNYNEGVDYTYEIPYTKNGGENNSNNQKLKTEDLIWRVLGINDNGELELISADPTKTNKVFLKGQKGWVNSENILNETCNNLYGKGIGAKEARCLNLNDVNKISGYVPETPNIREYSYGEYIQKDGTVVKASDSNKVKLENDYYQYNIQDYRKDNIAYMISDGTGSKGLNYWLANKSIEALDFNYVTYFVCAIRGGLVFGQNMHIDMYNEGYTAPFRPVVILSNDVNFESNSQSEHSSETSAWSIK